MIPFDEYQSSSLMYITMLFAQFLLITTRGETEDDLIYILQWTNKSQDSWESRSFWYLESGQGPFVSRNCSFQNCFITPDRYYFDSILDFDVLLFNIVDIRNPKFMMDNMPSNRSERQLYIFVASVPAVLSSISSFYNGFFNFTWTYKLASDIFQPYFVVKNNIGEVVGPKVDVKWLNYKHLPPTNKTVVRKLLNKRVAGAWVSAICKKQSSSVFIGNLVHELSKYGHKIDHYGRCGHQSCPRNSTERVHLLSNCYKIIERDYYFYLAFENYFAEDYVTEKVLHGLRHYLVPIVYGGADYTRFLPKGSYIDALKLGVTRLAKEMNDIINDPPRYYDFFKWHGYYSFQDTTDSDHHETICDFCAFVNNEVNRDQGGHTYHDMSNWLNSVQPNSLLSDEKLVTQEPETNVNNNIFTNFFYELFNDED